MSIEPFNFGNSTKVRCPSSLIAKQILDHLNGRELFWGVAEDQVKDKLRVKFEESYESRKKGAYCYKLFDALLQKVANSTSPVPVRPFVTDKKGGRVKFKVGPGYIVGAKFEMLDNGCFEAMLTGNQLPRWITPTELKDILDAVSSQFLG